MVTEDGNQLLGDVSEFIGSCTEESSKDGDLGVAGNNNNSSGVLHHNDVYQPTTKKKRTQQGSTTTTVGENNSTVAIIPTSDFNSSVADGGSGCDESSSIQIQSVTVNLDVTTDQERNERNKRMETEYKRLISEKHQCIELDEDHADVEVVQSSSLITRIVNHRSIRRNWKVYLASFVLTVGGLAFVITGLALGAIFGFLQDLKSIVFLVGGVLCLIPGAYHFIYMSCAAMGARGFSFGKLSTLRI